MDGGAQGGVILSWVVLIVLVVVRLLVGLNFWERQELKISDQEFDDELHMTDEAFEIKYGHPSVPSSGVG